MLHCSLRASATPLPYMEQKGSASRIQTEVLPATLLSSSSEHFYQAR